ncbi:MAG: hypothetical protein K6G61_06385 [Solobacterium sp.]|nr:hypothetical protein [Solobacterium sp.]
MRYGGITVKKREYRVPISRKNLEDVMKTRGKRPTDIIKALGYEEPQVWYKYRREEKFTLTDIDLMAQYLRCDPDWLRGYDRTGKEKIYETDADGSLIDVSRFGYYHSIKKDAEMLDRGQEITSLLDKLLELLADDYLHVSDNNGGQISYHQYLRDIEKQGLQPAVSTDALFECIVEKINRDSSLQYRTVQTVRRKKERKTKNE